MNGSRILQDSKTNIKEKLSGLWVSTMLYYIYGDYFGLYQPGNLDSMLKGQMGPLGPTTQGVLVGTAIMMAIPSVMVFLSLALKAAVNRWVNMILALAYTLIMFISMPGAWNFYLMLGVIEMSLTWLIFWYALKWPRQ